MKRIHIETLGDKTAKVYRDSDYDEYRVRLYIRDALHALADYFTGDKADAIATAAAMVRPDLRRARPLSVPFNVAVLHITSRVLPCGFDVSEHAPQDFDSLIAHYDKTGRVLVWNGASDKTIFADSEVNFAFRAWHDSKHIIGGFPFTREGEMNALAMQKADILAIYDGATADYFCALLDAEVRGQFEYQKWHGGFPVDQIGFARAYLADRQRAVESDFGISAEVAGSSWKSFEELDRNYSN
jgi:hypothetical protein